MATKTVGLTGRDYSTLAAWASYAAALNMTENEVLEVYNDGGPVADTVSITLGGWTANGFSLTIRPASGQGIRHNVNKLTNAYRYNTANGAALTNSIGYADAYILSGANLIVEDLQLRTTNNAASSCVRPSNGVIVRRSILWRNGGSYVVNQANNATFQDSLIVNGAGGGGISVNGDNLDIDNCTLANISGGGIGIQQDFTQSVPPRVRNTAFRGFTTAAQGTYRSGSTANATTTASWTGTGISGTTSIADTEWESVTASSEDFRLRTTASATMKTGGASGVGTGLDGVATTRGSTNRSIGAWEAPAAGDTTPPTLTGSITIGTVTSTSIQMSWPAGSDNVAVTSYEVSSNGGTSYTDVGNVLTYTFTGLTPSTSYGLRVRAKDAAGNVSTPALSATQSTGSGGDTAPPTLTGTITIGTVTSTSIQISHPAGADNVAVTSYEYSSNGGTSYTDSGSTSTSYTFTGLTPSTSYALRVRAKDAAGNVSTPPLSATQSTNPTPSTPTVTITLTTDGSTAAANLSALKWAFWDYARPDLIAAAPSAKGAVETTNASGVLVLDVTGTTLSSGQVGWLVVSNTDGLPATNHSAFTGPVALD